MAMAIEIRTANPTDLSAVRRLAERDSAVVPAGELLLAIDAGCVRAARSEFGEVIADPFAPTAALVATLEAAASESPSVRAARRPREAPMRARLAR